MWSLRNVGEMAVSPHMGNIRLLGTYEAGRVPRRPGVAIFPMYLCDQDPAPYLDRFVARVPPGVPQRSIQTDS